MNVSNIIRRILSLQTGRLTGLEAAFTWKGTSCTELTFRETTSIIIKCARIVPETQNRLLCTAGSLMWSISCPYLTGNTLRLRYEPNRLMLSIGLWPWCINITSTMMDIIRVRVTLQLPVSQSVSQYVLASSPLCGRLTRHCFLFKRLGLEFIVLSLWGSLSDERPGLFFVSHSLVFCLCVHLLFTFLSFTPLLYIYIYIYYTIHTIYTRPLLVPARYSRLCPTTH
jgi:hypothetical protein